MAVLSAYVTDNFNLTSKEDSQLKYVAVNGDTCGQMVSERKGAAP